MNFFAAEDRAKRATVVLVVLYLASVTVVVAAADTAFAGIVAAFTCIMREAPSHSPRQIVTVIYSNPPNYEYRFMGRNTAASFDAVFRDSLPWPGVALLLVVIIATAMKVDELRGGGTTFCGMLAGRMLSDKPTDPREAQLKNVVEEMAVATGVKPPQVCVLDNEPGINSFAAGTNNMDPVIGVTAGCLKHLTRDELQAIVAHEFSHILHNDTTLNTRAYAMLFGLMAISIMGANVAGISVSREGRPNQARNATLFLVIGLALYVIGWIGGLAGRMVRAAIVREREFLADASAVQYTRNADSVASALYKMATIGSHLLHSTGEEVEHFFFGAASAGAWGRFAITRAHPRAPARINAIKPGYQPSDRDATPVSKLDEDSASESTDYQKEMTDTVSTTYPDLMNAPAVDAIAEPVSAQPGDPPSPPPPVGTEFRPPKPPEDVLAKIPENLRTSAGDAESAAAVCFALAAADLAPDKWACVISSFADDDTANQVNAALPDIKALPFGQRMALLDIVVPALQTLPDDEQTALDDAVKAILGLTAQPDMIAMAVVWRLSRYLGSDPPSGPVATSWTEGAGHVAVLLASIVRSQYGAGVLGHNAYDAAAHSLASLGPLPPMPPPEEVRPANVQTALMVLAAASPATREAVVSAAGRVIEQEQIPEDLADFVLRLICDAADQNIPDVFDRWV